MEESDADKATRLVDMLAAVASPETGAGLTAADAAVALGEVYGDASSLSEAQRIAVDLAMAPYGLDLASMTLKPALVTSFTPR